MFCNTGLVTITPNLTSHFQSQSLFLSLWSRKFQVSCVVYHIHTQLLCMPNCAKCTHRLQKHYSVHICLDGQMVRQAHHRWVQFSTVEVSFMNSLLCWHLLLVFVRDDTLSPVVLHCALTKPAITEQAGALNGSWLSHQQSHVAASLL